jgi:Na+:H+ antiporter, NhaA family
LAVIDDLGAILVIAIFYSAGIALGGIIVAVCGVVAVMLLRHARVEARWIYAIPALVTWGGTLTAGIHPTIAGVALGLLTPVEPFAKPSESPAEYWLRELQPWVTFAIMPIFALANAGVRLKAVSFDASTVHIMLGVGVGLVLGKPLGVFVASQIALKTKIATLPPNLTALHLVILGCVAGVGFTMSLFVAQLAFTRAELLDAAKLSIVVASSVAGLGSLALGRRFLGRGAGAVKASSEPSPTS